MGLSEKDPYLGAISSGKCDERERRKLCPWKGRILQTTAIRRIK
jgi:hypothetical protein